MSEKSSCGATPCEYRFSARLTTSKLPVRSPLPNSVPSMRSAPAISANSPAAVPVPRSLCGRSEEHTSELQSLMRISYAVFCLKKKKNNKIHNSKKAQQEAHNTQQNRQ